MTTETKTKRTIKSKRTIKNVDDVNKAIKANTSRPAGTFTTVDLANEQGVNPKTLRARIRRNINGWEPLFIDGQRHVFKDNKTTRAKVEALMA